VNLLRSLRLRLTLWYILLLALILAAFSAGIYLRLRHNLYASLDDSLETRADELLVLMRFEAGRPTLAGAVPEENQDADDQYVRVFDASGGITFDNGLSSIGRPDDERLRAALDGRATISAVDGPGAAFRTRLAPILESGEVAGALAVGRTEDDVTDTLDGLLLVLGLSYPATLALASLGGVFLAGRALAPIDRLTRVARRISAEDLSRRLDLRLPDDEVGRLARTFDEMLDRLDRAFRQQRQFTSDASHELRTPLTAMKGQVEVALSRERSTDDYRGVLRLVNDEVDRLIRLVGSLLSLARADAGEIALRREDVDVGDLVRAACEQVRPLAADRGLGLEVEAGGAVTVRADQDLLLQLLLNLLDNALKYTPAGGRIAAGWRPAGAGAEVSVSNTGPGIAPEELPRIFDRFYRVDKARSRAEGGAGLGLSIAKWIAEAHGGTLTAASEPDRGVTFTVALPPGDDGR